MSTVFNKTLATSYTSDQEWLFRPTGRVTILVANGPVAATFMLYLDPASPYNGQAYEGFERPMTTFGQYGWSSSDFSQYATNANPNVQICGVKLRSTVDTQLALIDLNA